MIRQGRYVMDVPFPYPVGREFSGTVHAIGDGVRAFKEGDAVFGTMTDMPTSYRKRVASEERDMAVLAARTSRLQQFEGSE
jgi:NADPH:quinone reductase-like Zn-dependent oxidoreductase